MKTNIIKTLAGVACISAAAFITSCNSSSSDGPELPGGDKEEDSTLKIEVISFLPAPGQFVNELPEYEAGDDNASMLKKATYALNNRELVSLGSFGGCIVMKLSQPIRRVAGKPEFQVIGNSINGSSEPGIVSVSSDGKTWFQLKGEMYEQEIQTTVTFHQPTVTSTAEEYIFWETDIGESGYLNRYKTHDHSFFPLWLKQSVTAEYTGRRVPDNCKWDETKGMYWQTPYEGYADSYPNGSEKSYLDLDNAVDAQGRPVEVDAIYYVKVVSAVLQCNGDLGEASTEIAGIEIFEN